MMVVVVVVGGVVEIVGFVVVEGVTDREEEVEMAAVSIIGHI